MRIVLIPCGPTEWRAAGRLLGRVEIPFGSAGPQQCCAWADLLNDAQLARILHGPDELATRTAALIGRRLGVPAKALDGLAEVDVGLWAGLTDEQLRTRYASVHRELLEAPLNVVPPQGEGFGAAAARLASCVRRQTRRNGLGAVGIVTRPLGLAILRCALESRPFSDLWQEARRVDEPVFIECAAGLPVSGPEL